MANRVKIVTLALMLMLAAVTNTRTVLAATDSEIFAQGFNAMNGGQGLFLFADASAPHVGSYQMTYDGGEFYPRLLDSYDSYYTKGLTTTPIMGGSMGSAPIGSPFFQTYNRPPRNLSQLIV